MHAAFPANTLAIFGKPEVKEPPQPDPPVIEHGPMLSLRSPLDQPTHSLSPQELESRYLRFLYRIKNGSRFGDMDKVMAQVLATVCAADFH